MGKLATYMIVWSLKKMKAVNSEDCYFVTLRSRSLKNRSEKFDFRVLFQGKEKTRKEKALKFFFKGDEKLTT